MCFKITFDDLNIKTCKFVATSFKIFMQVPLCHMVLCVFHFVPHGLDACYLQANHILNYQKSNILVGLCYI